MTDIVERLLRNSPDITRPTVAATMKEAAAVIAILRAERDALRDEVKRLAKRINRQRVRIRFFENCETASDKYRRRLVIQTRFGARYWDARIKKLNARKALGGDHGA